MFDELQENDFLILPDLWANGHLPNLDKIVGMHLFSYQTDWFFCEYNPAVRNAYGMMVLHADFDNAKWGYFTFPELEDIHNNIMEIHWNKNFTPRSVRDLRPLRVKFNGNIRVYT